VLVARARGLSTHLLTDERVQVVERAMGAEELSQALRETPYREYAGARAVTPAAVDRAVGASLAARMALLAKWASLDGDALAPICVEQEAHNVRDLLRGMMGALTPEERVAHAIPTPALGRARLDALARLESPGAVASQLVAWEHPLGSALLAEALASRPDLFRLEAALAQRSAEVATRAARGGGRHLRAFVREAIDAHNAVTALLLTRARVEGASEEFFVAGGEGLRLEDLARAASAGSGQGAAEALAAVCQDAVLAEALRGAPAQPGALSTRILTGRIAAYARRARREPLTAVPVLLFVLRLRREARAVRHAIWAAALAGGRPA